MIRTEREYKKVVRELEENRSSLAEIRTVLERQGLDEDAVWRLISPIVAMQSQAQSEVTEYEQARRAEVGPFGFADIGRYLVKLRIAKGWGPRQLANALKVDEALISRDERDEYQGITKERAQRILDVLGVQAYIVPLFQRPPATLELPNVLSPRQLATVIRADPYSYKQFPESSNSLGGIPALGRNTVFTPAKGLDPVHTGSNGKSIFPPMQGVIAAGGNNQQNVAQL